jgi:plasmid stabilization system protein ParE
MPRLIIWSSNALQDAEVLIVYLRENWSENIAIKYTERINSLVLAISIFPKLYPIINKKLKIRKCVISKHNSIYYLEKNDKIEILNIFDTRQHPKKLIKKINKK